MVFVRISRKCREISYKPDVASKFSTVNFMRHLKMNVDQNSYMGGSIFWSGFHHLQELLFLRSYLTSDMTFVDIGANQGEFSIYAASKVHNGKVYSFEPVDKQRNYLLNNIELNAFKNIVVFDYGLSDKINNMPIYTSTESKQHYGTHEGLSTLFPSDKRQELEQFVSIKVFDSIFYDSLDRLDFIKIDIEGGEIFALNGMKKSIRKFLPVLLIEINEETFNSAGYKTIDILNFLAPLGYMPYKIYMGSLVQVNESQLSQWGNYIFKI